MSIDGLDIVPPLLVSMKAVMMVVCIIFLISGLDDVFIDVLFAFRWMKQRLLGQDYDKPLSREELLVRPEQTVAVMLPAWDEGSIIGKMLRHAITSINYHNVHYFVGTYPNDYPTQQAVDRVAEKYRNVHRIMTSRPGPTSKADCLNCIYEGIEDYEKANDSRFEIVVVQDCEDVIHPLCFKLFNYLIPRKDMVQVPVHSLRRKWYEFTAGHYIDEFAQLHIKDLVVRESFSGSIPTAGVGVAFSRRALEVIATERGGQLFDIHCLTEDYDFGFRLHKLNMKQSFARVSLPATGDEASTVNSTRHRETLIDRDLICVKEYFPKTFSAAVRQKSRWVVGIALQGWAKLGWAGDWRIKYMLFRDRKVLITNLVNVLGYIVAGIVLAVWIRLWVDPDSYRYPPLLERQSLLWYIVLVNACLLFVRIAVRGMCVKALYGWKEALMSFPRMIWGNVVNFFATCRAIGLYLHYLRTGRYISWDKTAHHFPAEEDLLWTGRRLGEILLSNGSITADDLGIALRKQKKKQELIGRILLDMGVLNEQDLKKALDSVQAGGLAVQAYL